MTPNDVIEVAQTYRRMSYLTDKVDLEHLRYMCDHIVEFIREADNQPELRRRELIEKAHRWLGFVQGALWTAGIYTLEELRDHNVGAKI